MAAIYVRYIQQGRMTIEEVPAAWRDRVESMLKEAGYYD